MYGLDKNRFLSVMNGAVSQIDRIIEIADQVSREGYDNIYLVGSGGTYAIISPLAYMFKTHSDVVYYHDIAAEVSRSKPKSLGENSLVITSSLTGTTVETIEVVQYARSVGARTIAFVGDKDSTLGQEVDLYVENDADNDTLVEELHLQMFALGARLMKNRGEFPEYNEFIETLRIMPEVLLQVRIENDERAEAFAKKHKDTKFHMFVGAGNTWGETYCYAMCVLEEMQWIATKSIHAAEFFHGTIEMTNEDMSFVLIKGEDATRPLVDRVENFVRKHSKYVQVFDTKDYELKGVSQEMRELVAPMVNATQLARVSSHLENERNHPLDTRRFYRKVEY